MTSDCARNGEGGRNRRHFETTHWSMVLAAADTDSSAQQALAELCELYWYPLYAQKRGSGQVRVSIDMSAGESRIDLEPAHDMTPDRLHERQ